MNSPYFNLWKFLLSSTNKVPGPWWHTWAWAWSERTLKCDSTLRACGTTTGPAAFQERSLLPGDLSLVAPHLCVILYLLLLQPQEEALHLRNGQDEGAGCHPHQQPPCGWMFPSSWTPAAMSLGTSKSQGPPSPTCLRYPRKMGPLQVLVPSQPSS